MIRKKGGIPKNRARKGDVVVYFNGAIYVHTALYMGDGKIADDRSVGGAAIRPYDISGLKPKFIFRYTGK